MIYKIDKKEQFFISKSVYINKREKHKTRERKANTHTSHTLHREIKKF